MFREFHVYVYRWQINWYKYFLMAIPIQKSPSSWVNIWRFKYNTIFYFVRYIHIRFCKHKNIPLSQKNITFKIFNLSSIHFEITHLGNHKSSLAGRTNVYLFSGDLVSILPFCNFIIKSIDFARHLQEFRKLCQISFSGVFNR